MVARQPWTKAALEDVGNDGERMVVVNAFGYWAHLSIYRFAVPLASGRDVLDAGSGEGYGATYLAQHGAASVLGLDAGAEAVAHARRRYPDPRVRFDTADLSEPLPLPDGAFGVVFSSNVFEHVARVDVLAAETARVLAPGGVAVVAVPPVVSPAALEVDIQNHFHVNHLPPAAWAAKLGRFFAEVRCHRHLGSGEFSSSARIEAEIATAPDRVVIRETAVEELNGDERTITAIFVCRLPRAEPLPGTLAERTPAEWCEGAVAARLLAAERATAAELRAELAAWREEAPPAADDVSPTAALRRAGVAEARGGSARRRARRDRGLAHVARDRAAASRDDGVAGTPAAVVSRPAVRGKPR